MGSIRFWPPPYITPVFLNNIYVHGLLWGGTGDLRSVFLQQLLHGYVATFDVRDFVGSVFKCTFSV